MAVALRFRDIVSSIVPYWLSDRPGFDVGYKYIWSVAAILDAGVELVYQGVQAAWPGQGTPTALPYIGRTRSLIQGMAESDDAFAVRLRGWLETHAAGRTQELARQLHIYLSNNPMVRIVDRSGYWFTVAADGTETENQQAWDWDSVSNPERVDFWSDMWIIIYPTTWAARSGTLGDLTGDDGVGLGMVIPHDQAGVVRTILAYWKGAHSNIRAVLWSSDATKYDPTNPSSLPDGQWGQFSNVQAGNGSRVASHRDLTSTRYMCPYT